MYILYIYLFTPVKVNKYFAYKILFHIYCCFCSASTSTRSALYEGDVLPTHGQGVYFQFKSLTYANKIVACRGCINHPTTHQPFIY